MRRDRLQPVPGRRRRTATLLGYLHIKDALESDDDKRSRVIEDKWIRPFATVHPDDLLHDALESLQVKGAHMARVVRRDGEVVGLVTLEDVLEELVGEIRDARAPRRVRASTPR